MSRANPGQLPPLRAKSGYLPIAIIACDFVLLLGGTGSLPLPEHGPAPTPRPAMNASAINHDALDFMMV